MITKQIALLAAVALGAWPALSAQRPLRAIDRFKPAPQEAEGGGGSAEPKEDSKQAGDKHRGLIIKGIEPGVKLDFDFGKESPWVGLSVAETDEALAAQLGVEPGAGLTVNFVSPESPAAKAGFKKNDVLVTFENHTLVHPAQFRKLVQSRKEGDKVRIGFYRGGKEQQSSVVVGKTKPDAVFGSFGGTGGFGSGGATGYFQWNPEWGTHMRELQQQLKDLPLEQGLREQMKSLRESLAHLKIDQEKVEEELRASLEEARRSLEHALSQSSNVKEALDPARKALNKLESSSVSRDAKVIVRSEGNSVSSMVQADDEGTLVIIADPEPRLTAHDKSGKLLFDGPIHTKQQQEKVPSDVWRRVKPMLERFQDQSRRE